jgi:solute:Na+ symporter, SSS family
MIYPFLYLIFPRLWSVCHKHGYVTSADFVRGRYGNRWLALVIALTGILATMPYIALQLVGMQVVIGAMGIETTGLFGDLPLIIAFVILAAFTYSSGLRAPAMIAVVQDTLIYITVFAAIPKAKLLLAPPTGDSWGSFSAYATLALGSACALFLYPHSITGILSSSSGRVVRRNAAMLPAYSLLLGLLALVGFMAVAVGVASMPQFAPGFKAYSNNFSVPALFMAMFPDWFVGVAFAAIAIGALVPAAIMSIATANTYTRNVYREFINPNCTDQQESQMAKIVSLVIKAGALVFIFFVPLQYALWLQLLGGVWIVQTVPSVIIGLYTRFYHGWALFFGWVVGFGGGTWMVLANNYAPVYPLKILGTTFPCYIALATLVLNLVVATVLSLVFNAVVPDKARDMTRAADYA